MCVCVCVCLCLYGQCYCKFLVLLFKLSLLCCPESTFVCGSAWDVTCGSAWGVKYTVESNSIYFYFLCSIFFFLVNLFHLFFLYLFYGLNYFFKLIFFSLSILTVDLCFSIQSSYGARRSRRTWGRGSLWNLASESSWAAM